jgi:hypothetical protein
MGQLLMVPGDIFIDETGLTVQLVKVKQEEQVNFIRLYIDDDMQAIPMKAEQFAHKFSRIGHGPLPRGLRIREEGEAPSAN